MKSIDHINPEGLFKSPAFSQVIATQGHGKTLYIGGQNAVTATGEKVGKDDIKAQTLQVMQNIEVALKGCHATIDNVVKLSIYIVQGQDALAAFQAAQPFFKNAAAPPTITTVYVAALGSPEYLLEIDAVAFVPQ